MGSRISSQCTFAKKQALKVEKSFDKRSRYHKKKFQLNISTSNSVQKRTNKGRSSELAREVNIEKFKQIAKDVPATFEFPFSCKVCGKGFTKIFNFNRHQRVHSGEKPYPCEICHKHFARKDDVKTHCMKVHSDNIFVCEICNRYFLRKEKLLSHYKEGTCKKTVGDDEVENRKQKSFSSFENTGKPEIPAKTECADGEDNCQHEQIQTAKIDLSSPHPENVPFVELQEGL